MVQGERWGRGYVWQPLCVQGVRLRSSKGVACPRCACCLGNAIAVLECWAAQMASAEGWASGKFQCFNAERWPHKIVEQMSLCMLTASVTRPQI